MLSNSVNLLQQLVTAANGWRTDGEGVGVELFQINATFPDGKPVTLKWDPTASLWEIDT